MSIELPHHPELNETRELIESLIRSRPEVFAPCDLDDEGENHGPIENQSLCDWLLISHWMDEQGGHRYCRVNSTMTPHALLGLRQMFDD